MVPAVHVLAVNDRQGQHTLIQFFQWNEDAIPTCGCKFDALMDLNTESYYAIVPRLRVVDMDQNRSRKFSGVAANTRSVLILKRKGRNVAGNAVLNEDAGLHILKNCATGFQLGGFSDKVRYLVKAFYNLMDNVMHDRGNSMTYWCSALERKEDCVAVCEDR